VQREPPGAPPPPPGVSARPERPAVLLHWHRQGVQESGVRPRQRPGRRGLRHHHHGTQGGVRHRPASVGEQGRHVRPVHQPLRRGQEAEATAGGGGLAGEPAVQREGVQQRVPVQRGPGHRQHRVGGKRLEGRPGFGDEGPGSLPDDGREQF